jgi:hypothetical protein
LCIFAIKILDITAFLKPVLKGILVVELRVGTRGSFFRLPISAFSTTKIPIIMSKKQYPPRGELSYYGLSLLSYLRDSHPHIAKDGAFIQARADSAAEAYSVAIKSGLTHLEAEDAANTLLYRGLHFSSYNTIVNILWDEFADEIPEEDARAVALLMLPLCHEVLAKYPLSDDFADSPQYEAFYTELVGTVQILLEDGRL